MLNNIHSSRGSRMNGINYLLIACMLLVLVSLRTEWTSILKEWVTYRAVHVYSSR